VVFSLLLVRYHKAISQGNIYDNKKDILGTYINIGFWVYAISMVSTKYYFLPIRNEQLC
jgi:hypothetical protein